MLGNAGQVLGSIPAPRTTPNPNYNTGADPYNQTTTEDLGTLFSMIYDCANYGSGLMAAYPDGEYTQNECQQMLELMSANDLRRLLQGGIPAGTRISHKNGWLEDVHGDAGIVFPPNGNDYVIAVVRLEEHRFLQLYRGVAADRRDFARSVELLQPGHAAGRPAHRPAGAGAGVRVVRAALRRSEPE